MFRRVPQWLDRSHTAPYDKKATTCTNPACNSQTFQWQWLNEDGTRMWRYCHECWMERVIEPLNRKRKTHV